MLDKVQCTEVVEKGLTVVWRFLGIALHQMIVSLDELVARGTHQGMEISAPMEGVGKRLSLGCGLIPFSKVGALLLERSCDEIHRRDNPLRWVECFQFSKEAV